MFSECTAAMQNDQKLSTYPHRTTQYTFFDLNVNLYPQLITTATVDSPMVGSIYVTQKLFYL